METLVPIKLTDHHWKNYGVIELWYLCQPIEMS